jgi:hypothetical protein
VATLVISSNDPASPATVPLSGTGGQLPQGAIGPQGAAGQRGPAGPAGPAGKVELITCKTVKDTQRKAKPRLRCTGKVVSGTVTFTTGSTSDRATISRGRTPYATGASVNMGYGHSQLVLGGRRPVTRGRYTLTLSHRHGHRWITHRLQITIS